MKSFRVFAIVALIAGCFAGVRPVQAATSGNLVTCPESSSVYYLGEDGKRYVFQNEKTFFSWYKDFNEVQRVACEDLAPFPLEGVVWYQAGTRLVKAPSVPTVYVVEPNGTLRPLESEAEAIALFGEDWAERVDDISESFLPQYVVGEPLADGEIPEGTILEDDLGDLFRLQDLDDDQEAEAVEMDELLDDDLLENFALDLEEVQDESAVQIEVVRLQGLVKELVDLLRDLLDEDVFVPGDEEVDVDELDELDEEEDNDNDELSDDEDSDDDEDGVDDDEDEHPLDHDDDGVDDDEDLDDDNDGIDDDEEVDDDRDHDNDGLDDHEDEDDDNDDIDDDEDEDSDDHDNDGSDDDEDSDDDNDGTDDSEDSDDDENELDIEEEDSDNDGLSDDVDGDDDEDGVSDEDEGGSGDSGSDDSGDDDSADDSGDGDSGDDNSGEGGGDDGE